VTIQRVTIQRVTSQRVMSQRVTIQRVTIQRVMIGDKINCQNSDGQRGDNDMYTERAMR
jgi:hypothetical protein